MVKREAESFDIIHDHLGFFMFPLALNGNMPPILTTIHRPIDDDYFLFVGRLLAVKGVAEAIQAARLGGGEITDRRFSRQRRILGKKHQAVFGR